MYVRYCLLNSDRDEEYFKHKLYREVKDTFHTQYAFSVTLADLGVIKQEL